MERVVLYNTDQIRNLYNPNLKHNIETSVCSQLDDLRKKLYLNTKTKAYACSLEDFELLQAINELISPMSVDDSDEITLDDAMERAEKVQIYDIHDDIKLVLLDGTKKHLFIDLDAITNLSNQVDLRATLSKHEYTMSVYEMLLTHLEKRTNFNSLKKAKLYTKTLFNYVDAKLNANAAAFTTSDRINFKTLTNELVLK